LIGVKGEDPKPTKGFCSYHEEETEEQSEGGGMGWDGKLTFNA